jgi:hypothetical protein
MKSLNKPEKQFSVIITLINKDDNARFYMEQIVYSGGTDQFKARISIEQVHQTGKKRVRGNINPGIRFIPEMRRA